MSGSCKKQAQIALLNVTVIVTFLPIAEIVIGKPITK
jgi:hypothetical protein